MSDRLDGTPLEEFPLDGGRFLIRPLQATDSIVELTALLHRAYADLAARGMRFFASHQPPDVTAKRAAEGECHFGFHDDRMAATITFRPASRTGGISWYDHPAVASFGQFAVLPALQKRGVGSRLLDLVERRARLSGAGEIALDTSEHADRLIQFYQKRGYRFIQHHTWPDVNYRSVILSKRLSPAKTDIS